MVPIYGASTTVLINQAPANSSTVDLNALRTSESLAKTYVALLYKRPVLEAVVKNLKLDMSPQQLAQKSRVSTVRDTQLIVVTVEDTEPQRAADIANEIIRVFSQQTRELQASRYAASKENLEQELTRIYTDINLAQTKLELLKNATAPDEVAEQQQLQVLLAEYSSSYATVLNSYEGVRLAEAQTTDNLKVVEEAQVEATPIRPNVPRDTLLGIGVGAMIGIGLVFLIGYFDKSVKSREAAEELTGVPTLASIARMKGSGGPDKLITVTDGESAIGEAYRMLRVNIEFSAIDAPIRTIVITSGSSGEGKGTTAANLAVVFAKTGRKVILVDADLRRPALHKLFKQPNERGLTMALLRQIADPIDSYLADTGVDNLYLMPSGPLSPNPAELLGSQHMVELIGKLKAQADIVIFDSPPVLPVVDTVLLARACDATVLVVLASTRVEALKKAKERLIQSGAHLVGLVYNRAPQAENYTADYLGERKPLKRRERWKWRIRRLFRSRGADLRPAAAISNRVSAKGETTAILFEQPNLKQPVVSPKPRVNANGNGRRARGSKSGRS
jgi:non-specific protein-tyrosine kinase